MQGAKCFLSLSSCSLRPMNRALEFGFSESKAPLDVPPSLVLPLMNVLLICGWYIHQQDPACVGQLTIV